MYPLREQKSRVCIKILRAYAGIGDAEAQSPGMLWQPRDLPQVCPRPKKFKTLATRDTLHGSRPNLQQRARRSNCAHPTRRLRQRCEHKEMYPKGIFFSQLYIYIIIYCRHVFPYQSMCSYFGSRAVTLEVYLIVQSSGTAPLNHREDTQYPVPGTGTVTHLVRTTGMYILVRVTARAVVGSCCTRNVAYRPLGPWV